MGKVERGGGVEGGNDRQVGGLGRGFHKVTQGCERGPRGDEGETPVDGGGNHTAEEEDKAHDAAA